MTTPDTGPALTALGRLETGLQSAVKSLTAEAMFQMPETMRAVEARLRQGIQPGLPLPGKYVCEAVSALYAQGAASLTLRDLRSLCIGPDHACAACGGHSMMDASPDVLRALCARLRQAFESRQLEVESWYDLMQGYLRLGERNPGCAFLQDLLEETFGLASAVSPYPFAWLRILGENRDLIGKEPCKAAASRTLEGNFSELDALRKSMSIPCASWFWKELTVACAAQIAQFKTAAFIAAIPEMLQVSRFLPPALRDEVLRLFLERYVQCRERGPHAALRDFVIGHWGAPPLGPDAHYDLAGADARGMVQEWLVRDDLADFMALHPDAAEGERRLAFWSRYVRSVEFHRILLRPQALQEETPEIAQLKNRLSAGRLAGVPEAANALLLKIGAWVIVETADSGGAIYGYRYGRLPFSLEADALAIPCLRNGGPCDFRMIREDTLEGMWEDKLSPELATLGIRRDEGTAGAVRKPVSAPPAPSTKPAPPPEDDAFNEAEFRALAAEAMLDVEDLRLQDGGLWVTGDFVANHYAVQKLSGWGFAWVAGRGCRKY